MQESGPARTGAGLFLIVILLCCVVIIARPDALPPAPSPQTAAAASGTPAYIQIVPGEAAGQISIGMTLEQCETVLGPAGEAANLEDGQLVTWTGLDIAVQMQKGDHPNRPGETEQPTNSVANIVIRSTHYATENNIRIGSSADDVIKAYGPTENLNGMLQYPALGINFMLEDSKVSQIIVYTSTRT